MSIYPSEEVQWGWHVINLRCHDYFKTKEFYEALGFAKIDGSDKDTWAVLHRNWCEIHLFQGHIVNDTLNYRGGDVSQIRNKVEAWKWPISAEFARNSFIVRDPDNREVFFDLGKSEAVAFQQGQVLTVPRPDSQASQNQFPLGPLYWQLSSENPQQTIDFYKKLEFVEYSLPDTFNQIQSPSTFLVRQDQRPDFNNFNKSMHLQIIPKSAVAEDALCFIGADFAELTKLVNSKQILSQQSNLIEKRLELRDPDGRSLKFIAS